MMVRRVAALSIVLASLTIAACGGDGATKPDPIPDTDPDRLSITFGYYGAPGDSATGLDLFQMTKDGRLTTRFVSSPEAEVLPEWSNDGKKLLFNRGTYNGSLWVANADLTELRKLVVDPNPPANSYNAQSFGSWSPDGASIAFVRTIDGNDETGTIQSGIAVMSADGSGVRWLVRDGFTPSWSVKNRIAFSKDGFIWTTNPDGSGLLRVTSVGGDGFPHWSRDGSRLVILHKTRSANPNRIYDYDVVTIRADGTDRRTLVTGAFVYSASWSPDGAYILYDRHDQADLTQAEICTMYTIPAAGGVSVNLTPDRGAGACGGASWRPME